MKKSFLFFWLITLIISSCSDDTVTSGNNLKNEELQRMVDSLTNYYYTQRNITSGGFLVKINTSSGNYFSPAAVGVPKSLLV